MNESLPMEPALAQRVSLARNKDVTMKTRIAITALLSLMTNSVLFGIGAITVLSIPFLSERASYLLPLVIVASFLAGPVIAWFIAPHLRARYSRMRSRRLEVLH